MCGVVGYYGSKNVKDILLGGLKKLEYRGYDSSGVAILDSGSFRRIRAEGKLNKLENLLIKEKFNGKLGIAHTRWATHGLPTENNAHPHKAGPIHIVHNGIIENYMSLREELILEGSEFNSETDSEVIAHLIYREAQKGLGLVESVQSILPKLLGAYALLVVSEDHPEEIVAVKNGPPLILGVSQEERGEIFVASDLLALIDHVKEVIHLEDHELAYFRNQNWEVLNSEGRKIDKEVTEINWTPEKSERQGYSHFMLKEIYEQPRAVAQALDPHIDLKSHSVILDDKIIEDVEHIFIVACGTSFYAGLLAKYIIEDIAEVPVEVDIASEFRYRRTLIPKNSLVIAISQSGETADTLAALRAAKKLSSEKLQIKTLSICNVKHSSLDRETDYQLYMNAGIEVGVASTKALSCTIAVVNIFSVFLARKRSLITAKQEKDLVKSFLAIPSQMESVLNYDKFFEKAAQSFKKYKSFLYMGRGLSFPIAMEGALKLKELAYMHAEGYAAGEMKHGPLALIDKDVAVVMLVPQDDVYLKTISNLEEVKARGGQIISIGTGQDEKLKSLSLHYLGLPKAHKFATVLLQLIPLQLLSFHMAHSLGHDVDRPRNLAKSVTVE